MEEMSQVDKVTEELQLDLQEMSSHQVYRKYAYLSMEEIREAMLDAPFDRELNLVDAN